MADRSITIMNNGPYLVSGSIPLSLQTIEPDDEGGSGEWVEGKAIPTSTQYALCRCGASNRKPFCDGTHATIGFDGTETANRAPVMDQAERLDGPTMQLVDARELCASGRFCDPHGRVWNQVKHTDDPEVRTRFIQQVQNCPAGRLMAIDKATGQSLEPTLPVSIGLVEDPLWGCSGPLWVRGGIPVIGADGHTYELRNRMTLCRCGRSKNKPFCDGTHGDSPKFRDGL
ncbi:MAG: iron-binding protein [Nitrospira sp. SG-bin1]|nr:MAG: iron-binding protein [Nitrospira sp. SG-bin1]